MKLTAQERQVVKMIAYRNDRTLLQAARVVARRKSRVLTNTGSVKRAVAFAMVEA